MDPPLAIRTRSEVNIPKPKTTQQDGKHDQDLFMRDISIREKPNSTTTTTNDTITKCWYAGDVLPGPLELRNQPTRGDGLFATRDISVSEVICALPHCDFMAIGTSKLGTSCYSCLAITSTHVPNYQGLIDDEVALKFCGSCRMVKFCSKECQVKAWHTYHKYECKIFHAYQDNFPTMLVRAIMRIVLLQDKDRLPQKYWNTLMNDLVSHEAIWTKQPGTQPGEQILDMVRGIKHVTNSLISIKTLTKLFWVMKTNSIEIPVAVHGGIGMMLDPLFSKLNHNCDANVMLYRPWHTSGAGWNLDSSTQLTAAQRSTFATVVPMRHIKAGKELTISYSDPTTSVKERNDKHKRSFSFECSCRRCVDDLDAIAKLEKFHPGLPVGFEYWTKNLIDEVEQLSLGKGAAWDLDAVVDTLDRVLQAYLDYPELYAASWLEQIFLQTATYALEHGAYVAQLTSTILPHLSIAHAWSG